jgi:putative membrane fusion protein
MGRRKKLLIGLFLIATAALYVVIYMIPGVTGAFRKTVVLEYGSLVISDDVRGYVVRGETVYLADRSGEIRYYAEEGLKVRRNARLLDIIAAALPAEGGEGENAGSEEADLAELTERVKDEGVTLSVNDAPEGGVISYYIDGREALFSPENMLNITRDEAESAAGDVKNVTRHDGFVRSGEPVYKIADDALWYMIFWLDADSPSIVNYKTGATVTLVLPGGEVRGRVHEIIRQENAWMVLLRFDRYYEGMARARALDAKVIAAEHKGLIVENECITLKDGQRGVYALGKNGEFRFVPVNVIRGDGVRSIISRSTFIAEDGAEVSTVNVYEEILKDPD